MAELTGKPAGGPDPLRIRESGRLNPKQLTHLRNQLRGALNDAGAVWKAEGVSGQHGCLSDGTNAARLAEIERHLSEATPGEHQRDCGGRIFAAINGKKLQIGEAFSLGDARLWRHAATDIRWLLDEVERLNGELGGRKGGE